MSDRDDCKVCGLPLSGHSDLAVRICLREAREAEQARR